MNRWVSFTAVNQLCKAVVKAPTTNDTRNVNNFSSLPISTEKYRSTDISGDYAAMARAFGGHGERVTKPEDIIPAIKRGIQKTKEGIPVLLEFITSKETEVSRPGT